MKRTLFFVLAGVLCLLTRTIMAEDLPLFKRAIEDAAVKLREKLLEEPPGGVVFIGPISNEADDPARFALSVIEKIRPVLQGPAGERNLAFVNEEKARKETGVNPDDFAGEEAAGQFFRKLGNVDYIVTGKVDGEGNFSIQGFGGDGDFFNLDVPFQIDDEYFRLYNQFTKPAAPGENLRLFSSEILDISYSQPYGDHLAVAAGDGSIVILDAGTGAENQVIRNPGKPKVTVLSRARNNSLAALDETGMVTIYDGGGAFVNSFRAGDAAALVYTGGRIFTGGAAGTSACDLAGNRLPLSLPAGPVKNLVLTPDKKRLVVHTAEGISVHDTESGTRTSLIRGAFTATATGNRYLAAAEERGLIKIYNIAGGGSPVKILKSKNDITSLSFSRNGIFLLSGDRSGVTRAWAVRQGIEMYTLEGHQGAVNVLAWRPAWGGFASGGADARLILRNGLAEPSGTILIKSAVNEPCVIEINGIPVLEDGIIAPYAEREFRAPIGAAVMKVRGNGIYFNVSYTQEMSLDVKEGVTSEVSLQYNYREKVIPDLRGLLEPRAAGFSPAGPFLAAGYRGSEPGQTGGRYALVLVWNTQTGTFEIIGDPSTYHRANVNDIRYDATGRRLFSASDDGTVKAWDLAARKLAGTLEHGGKVVSSDIGEKLILTGSAADTKVWDAVTYQYLCTLQGGRGVFSGGVIKTFEKSTVRVYDLTGNQIGLEKTGHDYEPVSIAAPVSGGLLITYRDETSHITGRSRSLVIPGNYAAAGNEMIASATDNIIELRDLTTGEVVDILAGHEKEIAWLAFSKNGALLSSCSRDGTLRLWDVQARKELGQFLRYRDGQTAAVVDGYYLGDDLHLRVRSGSQTRDFNEGESWTFQNPEAVRKSLGK
ncbi:MAG: hypothetical protein LBI86_01000 [Treponema sp.]|jgi:WD40 repeat protein|nr:hypothetical protein [Treponema sp.]